MNPLDGTGESNILFNSSAIRSREMIRIRSLLRSNAENVTSSM